MRDPTREAPATGVRDPRRSAPDRAVWANRLAEGLVLGMACAAPWMFGAVDAWAELALTTGIGLFAVLSALWGRHPVGWRELTSAPSLALAGLVVLALVQAAPLPVRLLGVVDPSAAALRRELVPDAPERVLGDVAPPVPLPSATLSQEPAATLGAAARLVACWLLFQGVVGLGGGPEAVRRFGVVISLNAALLAVFALVQGLTWNGKIYWTVPSPHADAPWSGGGPFVSHSHLAEYLNTGFGLALGLLLGGAGARRSTDYSGRAWAAYLVGVLALGIVTSGSRGGVLAMIAGSAVALVGLRTRGAGFWAGVVASAVLLLLFLGVLGDAAPYAARLETLTGKNPNGVGIRVEIWRDSLRAWGAHPIFGSGLGTFGVSAAPFFRGDHGVFYAHAENEYVEMLVEGGVVGSILASAGLVGLALRARRALAVLPSPTDRGLVFGGCAGLVAVSLQFLGDFGLHVPAVSFPLVVLCAHLCRLGASPGRDGVPAASDCRASRRHRFAAAAVAASITLAVVPQGVRRSRAEALVASVGLPAPGAVMPTTTLLVRSTDELGETRSALARAVRLWPEWTEGHLRLGLTELSLYRATAAEWLSDSVTDADEREHLSDPLWLLTLVGEGGVAPPVLAGQEPVRLHLVPAAREFLEARRLCPVSALAHAELGCLSPLLVPNGRPDPYVRRALRTAGADSGLLRFAAEVAVRSGSPGLAADCWRKALRVGDAGWEDVADASASALAPGDVLRLVIPDDRGRYALRFADRLYGPPGGATVRERFLRAAAARLPEDLGLSPAERLRLEALAWSGLGERGRARERIEAALALEPEHFEWRKDYIEWLLAWGDYREAHDQALVASRLSPGHPDARRVVEQTAEAVARADSPAADPSDGGTRGP